MTEGVALGVLDIEGVGDIDIDGVTVGVGEGEAPNALLGLGVTLIVGVRVGVTDIVGVTLGVLETLGVLLGVGGGEGN